MQDLLQSHGSVREPGVAHSLVTPHHEQVEPEATIGHASGECGSSPSVCNGGPSRPSGHHVKVVQIVCPELPRMVLNCRVSALRPASKDCSRD
jgi:hypothetical protein